MKLGTLKNLDFVVQSVQFFLQILQADCTLSSGAPIVSRNIDQELNDVIDSIFSYYIASWMENLLIDTEEVIFTC